MGLDGELPSVRVRVKVRIRVRLRDGVMIASFLRDQLLHGPIRAPTSRTKQGIGSRFDEDTNDF